MPKFLRPFLLIAAMVLVPPIASVVSANEADYLVERVRFLQARKLLRAGIADEFGKTLEHLRNYPVVQYLYYHDLLRRMDKAGADIDAQVIEFAKKYAWSHLARQLVGKWQATLFERRDWPAFLDLRNHPLATDFPCKFAIAGVRTGLVRPDNALLRDLWLQQSLLSAHCEKAAKLVLQSVQPSAELVWQRIHRAMSKGAWRSANKMHGFLNQRDQAVLALWIDVYRNPGDNADNPALGDDSEVTRRIVAQQHQRWSRYDVEAADAHWQTVRDRYQFDREQREDVDRSIALQAAYANISSASQRLGALSTHDEGTRAWSIRIALRNNRWQSAVDAISQLPENELDNEQWQYWLARAYEALGDVSRAGIIYRQLANDASYHGFLAADRLGVDYAIRDEPAQHSAQLRSQLLGDPEVLRAREYFLLGLRVDARRSWQRATKGLDTTELAAAASLASEWGWHDRAIFAIGKTPYTRSLALRFPMPYSDKVLAVSRRNALEPAWVYGVMRRESAFIADIRSHAGAIGLMQLMPKTAQYVAKQMGRKVRTGELIDENLNISLGSHYLRYVMDKFNDHQVLATAAYNAGPNRVSSWLPKLADVPADVWVDTIPFTETRRYVRAVLAYTTIFEWRLSQQVTRLNKRMRDVFAAR